MSGKSNLYSRKKPDISRHFGLVMGIILSTIRDKNYMNYERGKCISFSPDDYSDIRGK